jgi:exodeoxyribonuclease VII small subunit
MSNSLPPEDLGYAAALAELDEILRGLEANDTDVDQLAKQVHRASVLISVCRDRITGARMSVEEVVAKLESSRTESLFKDSEEA